MKEKACQLHEFCWLVLRSLVSQRLALLTRREKGKILLPVCLLSAVWPQTPTTQATLINDQIVEDEAIYNQVGNFSKDVIDLCWILYNKPRMVATFFFQRTTAFTLFLIVPSLQISCFRKTKEKQYAKYDLNKRIAARPIWQLERLETEGIYFSLKGE